MSDALDVHIRAFDDADTSAVVALWNALLADDAPHNEPTRAIQLKREWERDLFYVAVAGQRVVGTVMGGYDGHRGWIYALAVAPEHQRQGVATRLVAALEAALMRQGCLKINLQVRTSNRQVIAFYENLGYAVEDRVSMGKKTYSA